MISLYAIDIVKQKSKAKDYRTGLVPQLHLFVYLHLIAARILSAERITTLRRWNFKRPKFEFLGGPLAWTLEFRY